jgi:hypothetical protein
MQFADTASSISRVENRASVNKQYGYYKTINTNIRLGIVVKVGPVQNFEGSIHVYVYQNNETLKVEALAAASASGNGVGVYTPYFPGDKVLIANLFGDSNRPIIIARANDLRGLAEYLHREDIPLPQPRTATPTGVAVNPLPCHSIPEAVKYAGLCSVTVQPMILV